MTVYNCHHSSNCTLTIGGFYLCKSDLNEPRGTFITTKISNEIRNMAYTWCTLRCISKRNACVLSLEEMHEAMHSSLWHHSPWVPFISRKQQTARMNVEEETGNDERKEKDWHKDRVYASIYKKFKNRVGVYWLGKPQREFWGLGTF